MIFSNSLAKSFALFDGASNIMILPLWVILIFVALYFSSRDERESRFLFSIIDEVILPKDTRKKLIKAYSMLENKVVDSPKRKHGNIPL